MKQSHLGLVLLASFVLAFCLGVTCRHWDQHLSITLSPEPTLIDPLADIPLELRPLTIPYLRERDYRSQLEIGDVLERGVNYVAYLAWYDSDGSRVYGLLTIPTGEKPDQGWPAVILMHGYLNPSTYETNGRSYRGWWQQLASTGEFVVFKPDMRGHGQSEGMATGPYYGADYVVDALNARAALQDYSEVDPEAIGFWGHSMSGNTLLRAYAARPEIPVIALWAGAVYTYQDLIDYGITDPSYHPDPRPTPTPTSNEATNARQLFSRDRGIDLSSPFWRAMIPTLFLSDLPADSGAIGLYHAADDDVVSVRYSQDLNEILDHTALEHEFYEYPSGGHNMVTPTFSRAFTQMHELFRRKLIVEPAVRREASNSATIDS